MRISLVSRDLVDASKDGVMMRYVEEARQLGLQLGGEFKDWGLVEWNGLEYYMSSYNPPSVEDDDARPR